MPRKPRDKRTAPSPHKRALSADQRAELLAIVKGPDVVDMLDGFVSYFDAQQPETLDSEWHAAFESIVAALEAALRMLKTAPPGVRSRIGAYLLTQGNGASLLFGPCIDIDPIPMLSDHLVPFERSLALIANAARAAREAISKADGRPRDRVHRMAAIVRSVLMREGVSLANWKRVLAIVLPAAGFSRDPATVIASLRRVERRRRADKPTPRSMT